MTAETQHKKMKREAKAEIRKHLSEGKTVTVDGWSKPTTREMMSELVDEGFAEAKYYEGDQYGWIEFSKKVGPK